MQGTTDIVNGVARVLVECLSHSYFGRRIQRSWTATVALQVLAIGAIVIGLLSNLK
jgi:hypothetical protein